MTSGATLSATFPLLPSGDDVQAKRRRCGGYGTVAAKWNLGGKRKKP